ncbi:putative glycoside hydrolase [Nocardioides sp. URHA0020]|uniref:putative glycoside hydrolase n=1 Tax=Nocardioides sp. URHA0020 TaxID=1380392 RepID=UPI00048EA415|nr:putative glycoside hydrolase [Nocardioides sp. URHA0020]
MRRQQVRRSAVRAALVIALAVSVVTDTVTVAASAPADRRPAVRAGSPRWATGNGVLTLDWGDLAKTPQASRGDVVVMQSWEYPRIPALRRQHPGITILMYKDASAVVKEAESVTGRFPAGMGFAWAAAHHPSWFLRDRSGQMLEWSDWRGLYPMDVANSGYQQTWARNVIAELRAHRWDGVMMDDVLTVLSHPTVGGLVSTRLPDDRAQYAATESFLSHVAPRIRRRGYLAVPNLSVEWNNWRSTLTDWTRYVSGWENEHFTNWPGSSTRFSGADWRWKFDAARWLAARRVPLLAVSYGSATDRVGQTYHRATWLLSWNGRTGASVYVPDQASSSHWMPAATRRIGRPLRAPVEHANGTWTRRFTRGTVLVNPTGRTHRVLSVRLAPQTAVILARR